MQKTFSLKEEYYEIINDESIGLTDGDRARIYKAIFDYVFTGELPHFSGVKKAVFNLVLPSLELSKKRSESKAGKIKSKSNQNQNEIKILEKKEEKEPPQEKERSKEKEYIYTPLEREVKRDRPSPQTPLNEKNDVFEGDERGGRSDGQGDERSPQEEIDDTVKGYLTFMQEHPNVTEDILNPSEIETVDFAVLSEKIAESRFLQSRGSLRWLIKNYRSIVANGYKDFDRNVRGAEGRTTKDKFRERWGINQEEQSVQDFDEEIKETCNVRAGDG